jgi:hypothetical protein
LGLVLVEKILDMALMVGGILGGEEDGAASESMSQSIEGGAEFSGLGTGSGGMLGIGAVGGGAVSGGVAGGAVGGCDAVGRGAVGPDGDE